MSSRASRRFIAAFLAAVLSSAGTVVAETPLRVILQYDAPASVGCPSQLEFRAAVVKRLEYDPFVGEASRSVSVEISAVDDVLTGLLRWRDATGAVEGERHFASPDADCAELAKNMAFAVTVQLQLLEAPSADAPRSSEPSTDADVNAQPAPSNPQPSVEPASTPAPALAKQTPGSFELGAGIGPFVAFGWSPSLVAGGNAFFMARDLTWLAQLGFEMSVPDRIVRHDGNGFETSVLAASAVPCMRFRSIEACSVIRFGQVQVQGVGVDEPRTSRTRFSELGLRLGLGQALGANFEGKTHAEVVCTLSPWRVQLNGREAFSASSIVFLMGFDLVALFL